MPRQRRDVPVAGRPSGRFVPWWFFALLIGVATVAAYSNSLRSPFIFDDITDIVDNRSIRSLWPLRDVFYTGSADKGGLLSRPVVNLSLAINYAMGGLDTVPYHLTSLGIHILAALTLFGIVRRTLALPGIPERLGRRAMLLGLAAALIWALHPLQTQAVTYLAQRCESLMGLFYLGALYSLIRAGTSKHGRAWAGACVAAATLAIGSKEVAVSLPIMLVLYDRAFLAGSVREAWGRRRSLYLVLLGVWLGFALVLLRLLSVNRGSVWAGSGLPHSWQEYALSQFGVISHYLRLSLWPRPLVLDYGWPVAMGVREILPGALVVGILAAASAYALVRWPKFGFLGAWFFLILAPTSSILPRPDLAFLHRMYLPLAAIVVLAVLGVEAAVNAAEDRGFLRSRGASALAMGALAAAVAALAAGTWYRNRDHESAVSIWEDTVAKAPNNARALSNLGVAYLEIGKLQEAVERLQEAVRIDPNSVNALGNLGGAYVRLGNPQKAVGYLQEALRINPDYPDVLNSIGVAYIRLGNPQRAVGYLKQAVQQNPDDAEALHNLGNCYGMLGQFEESMEYSRRAIAANPDFALAYVNLGISLTRLGRDAEARVVLGTLQQIDPALARKLRAQIPGSGG